MTRRHFLTPVVIAALAMALLPVLDAPAAAAAAAAAPGVGDIFVADTGNNRVVHVTASGQSAVGSGFAGPRGIAIDAAGNVFVADTGNNRIVKLPADGSAQVTLGSGFNAPRGVTAAPSGDIFVADTGNNRVTGMHADGSNVTAVATHRDYLQNPVGMAAESDGTIDVSYDGYQRIFHFIPGDDTLGGEYGGTGNPGGGFAVDPEGIAYMTDTTDAPDPALPNNRGGITNNSGLALFGVGTGLNDPEGVNLTADGHLVVADTGNDRVVRLAKDGTGQVTVGSGFSKPSGVAVYAPPPTFTAGSPPRPPARRRPLLLYLPRHRSGRRAGPGDPARGSRSAARRRDARPRDRDDGGNPEGGLRARRLHRGIPVPRPGREPGDREPHRPDRADAVPDAVHRGQSARLGIGGCPVLVHVPGRRQPRTDLLRHAGSRGLAATTRTDPRPGDRCAVRDTDHSGPVPVHRPGDEHARVSGHVPASDHRRACGAAAAERVGHDACRRRELPRQLGAEPRVLL